MADNANPDYDYDAAHGQWILRDKDLALWLANDRRVVRCRIELVTPEHVYLKATTDDKPMRRGQVWREARYSRRVAPRGKVYVHEGRGHFNWRSVRIESAAA